MTTSDDQPDRLLRALGATRPARRDAARNRERVLDAARELFGAHGVERVSMEQIAQAAGVAKGTVFHRFGDRAGLALALVSDAEAELQEAVLRGPPPLGPGSPPRRRLEAFLSALLELTVRHRDLLLAADAVPGARLRTGAYAAWHQHVVYLLAQFAADTADATAHVLLAGLAPDLVRELAAQPAGLERLEAALHALVASVACAHGDPAQTTSSPPS